MYTIRKYILVYSTTISAERKICILREKYKHFMFVWCAVV
jgi:hypothetical protein